MYTWIDKYVLGLKDLYNGTNDIYEIYDYMNIDIIKLPNDSLLLKSNDAFYYRDYFDKEIVFIKDDLNFKYEKFILAHELGHAILHTDAYSAAFNKQLINKGKLEKQANYFAFKLLNIKIDKIFFEGRTFEQIEKALSLPGKCLSSMPSLE